VADVGELDGAGCDQYLSQHDSFKLGRVLVSWWVTCTQPGLPGWLGALGAAQPPHRIRVCLAAALGRFFDWMVASAVTGPRTANVRPVSTTGWKMSRALCRAQ
jgi:hypothetical protein